MASRAQVLGSVTFVSAVLGGVKWLGPPTSQPTSAADNAARPQAEASQTTQTLLPTSAKDTSEGCLDVRSRYLLCVRNPKVPRDSAKERTGSGHDLIRRFLGSPPEIPTCSRSDTISTTIVTLPDPVDSHLDWGFDAGLESIARAFERSGYVADRFSLPWANAMSTATVPGTARDTTKTWVRYPGTLLFRSADPLRHQLHLVFVVGEVPTIGIHKAALLEALAERESLLATARSLQITSDSALAKTDSALENRQLSLADRRRLHATKDSIRHALPCVLPAPGSDTLRIVGPAFSGSVRSLDIVLEQWRDGSARMHRPAPVANVITGSASSNLNFNVLDHPPAVRFSATVYPASSISWFINEVLVNRMSIPRERVAMLTESSTQFGASEAGNANVGSVYATPGRKSDAVLPSDTLILSIPFPVDISGLRTEYARHPVAPTRPEDEKVQVESRVPLSLIDPAHTTERPGIASAQLTVPAVDLAIREILRTLVAHRVRAVGIAATDVRDQLFLAGIIKERLRDVQLFMVGSNILFLRPDLNESLLGTMVLSTYPLFLENQFWDPTRRDRTRQTFTSDIAEGIYNAEVMQLDADSALMDYSRPISAIAPRQPPLWVTTVGRDALYPLTIPPESTALGGLYLRSDSLVPLVTGPELAQHTWEFVLIALALTIAFPIAYYLMQMRTVPRPDTIPQLLRADRISTAHEKARAVMDISLMQQRELFVAIRFVPILVLALAAVFALLRPVAHGDARWEARLLAIALIPLVVAGILIVGRRTGWRWLHLLRKRWRDVGPIGSRRERVLMIVNAVCLFLFFGGAALYIALVVLYLGQVLKLGPEGSPLYFERAIHFGSGVSPLAPVILGAAGMLAWSWWHLRRVELLQCHTEFEEACANEVEIAARLGPPDCGLVSRYRSSPSPARTKKQLPRRRWWNLSRYDTLLDRSHARVEDQGGLAVTVGMLRQRVLYLLPSATSLVVLAGLTVIVVWLGTLFERSMDSALVRSPQLAPHFDWLRLVPPLNWVLRTSPAFEWLLRFAALGAVCASTWSLYRFISVWRLLAKLLSRIAESPLAPAFARLPASLAQLTRIRLLPSSSDELVDESIRAKWDAVQSAYTHIDDENDPIEQLRKTMPEPPRAKWSVATGQDDERHNGQAFSKLYATLCKIWRAEKVQAAAQRTAVREKSETAAPPTLPVDASRRVKWMWAAEELAAVYVVDYVEWVFEYLRGLATFLLIALILMTVLIVAYPFQPASIVRTMYFIIIGVTVVTLIAVLFRMNRDHVLSAIAGTNANEVTWDGRFILNLLTFGAVPILTLLGSQFPALRGFLFAWVSPVLTAFTKT
jgi:hypothetical protein